CERRSGTRESTVRSIAILRVACLAASRVSFRPAKTPRRTRAGDETSPARKGEAVFEHCAQRLLGRLGEIRIRWRRVVLAGEIAAHRELHLHGMDAFGGAAIGAGDPAAGEPSIDH